jgi:hypothetical protein
MTTEEVKKKLIGSWTLTRPIGKTFYRFDETHMYRLAGGVPFTVKYKLVSNGQIVHIVADDETIEFLGFDMNDMYWRKAGVRYVLNRGTLY